MRMLLAALICAWPAIALPAVKAPVVPDKVADQFVPAQFGGQKIEGLLGERMRVGFKLSCALGSARLHAISAHAIDALRRESEMADNGDLGCDECLDQLNARALDLDRFSASLFHKADSVSDGVSHRPVIAAERHIGNHESATHGAAHGARVVQHLVDGDGKSVFLAEHDHGERVADEDQIHAGLVDQARGRVVVRGQRGDGLALALHLSQRGHGDFRDGNTGLRKM